MLSPKLGVSAMIRNNIIKNVYAFLSIFFILSLLKGLQGRLCLPCNKFIYAYGICVDIVTPGAGTVAGDGIPQTSLNA